MRVSYEDFRTWAAGQAASDRARFTGEEPLERRLERIAAEDPDSILVRDALRAEGKLTPALDPWRPKEELTLETLLELGAALPPRADVAIAHSFGLPPVLLASGPHSSGAQIVALAADVSAFVDRMRAAFEEFGKILAAAVTGAVAAVRPFLEAAGIIPPARSRPEPRRSRATPRRRNQGRRRRAGRRR